MRSITALQEQRRRWLELLQKHGDLRDLWQLGMEDEDQSLEIEIRAEWRQLVHLMEQWQLELLLAGAYDRRNAIITLHAGAGGTDSQDWVEILYRMYTRWAEARGYRWELWDHLPGDEAGIKRVTINVAGLYAYGYLKAERGVHRLVRLSPFDSSGRRHTSFASMDVIPEVEQEAEVSIDPQDLKVDTFRAGGAGGQHVNKTDSAVRITHLPTGIVAQCQNERSQHSNRLTAMKMIQSRLFDLQRQAEEKKMADLRGDQQEISWGSQIRSYVLHPYTLVKDHRTGVESGNVDAVLDGALDPYIAAYLRQFRNHQTI